MIVNVIPCHQNCQKGSSLTAKNVTTGKLKVKKEIFFKNEFFIILYIFFLILVIEIIMISNVGDSIAELTSGVAAINPHGIEPPGVPHAHHP